MQTSARMAGILVGLMVLSSSVVRADDARVTHLVLGAYLTAAQFDGAITAYCHGQGRCHELNPMLRPIVERHGVVAAMTVKGAMHAGIAGLLLHFHERRPRTVLWATVGLTAAQIYIDAHNVRALKGIR